MKPCRVCGVPAPPAYPRVGNICKPCHRARVAASYRSNPEVVKRRVRDNELRNKYGLTREAYESLIAGGCSICGSTVNLHIDHDHSKPGTYRGALCRACNWAVGAMNDDPRLFARAAEYLKGGDAL